eukprot:CAMPEP_0178719960 /NCGR_PEP_ID=MMETSP0699-20121125/23452_1 /TAXON_ID=265572 /ORGANISM="Extubocellulus spinifer, Strain CCMP396" /LENGTH=172 /DNA_ID=CAMNT_0020370329 /DNA_START=410 /DNA_END=926 /DNA_ORIENTATION=+
MAVLSSYSNGAKLQIVVLEFSPPACEKSCATIYIFVAPSENIELVTTDLADHLPLINKTLEQNKHLVDISSAECKATLNPDTQGESSQTKAFVTEHKWGVAEGDDRVVGTFDFIFGSDLAYRDSLHAPLISSLDRLSHENTVSLIGVTMADTKPSFFQSLKKAGFRYERLSD